MCNRARTGSKTRSQIFERHCLTEQYTGFDIPGHERLLTFSHFTFCLAIFFLLAEFRVVVSVN